MSNQDFNWTELRERRTTAVQAFYLRYRDGFVRHAEKEFGLDANAALDLYQDATVVLLEKLQRPEALSIEAKPVTYLYGIGRFLWYGRNRKQVPVEQLDALFSPAQAWEESSGEEEMYGRIEQAWRQLSPVCQELIHAFYYLGKKLDVMLQDGRYQSKDVLKSQKARCLKQLKALVYDGQ